MRTCARGLCVLLVAWSGAASAVAADDERARIDAQRRALTMQFDAREQACRTRLAATSCAEDVRALKRQALAPLLERELQLDAAERQQRQERRQAAVAAKRLAATTRVPQPVSRALAPGKAMPAAASAPRPAPSAAADSTQRRLAAEEARAAQAAANARSARREQAEIRVRQARIARRQAEHAATANKATPLTPPASAAARR